MKTFLLFLLIPMAALADTPGFTPAVPQDPAEPQVEAPAPVEPSRPIISKDDPEPEPEPEPQVVQRPRPKGYEIKDYYGIDNHYGQGGYYQGPRGRYDSDEAGYLYALEATRGACNMRINPHSYACHQWNFANNPVFPLYPMNWDYLEGDWVAVTYANPGGNQGAEFAMGTVPGNPLQPSGIVNVDDGSLMGKVIVLEDGLRFTNWRGSVLETDPESFRQLDEHTVEVSADDDGYTQVFTCRDFNRKNRHHILCAWDIRTAAPYSKLYPKGFIGLLSASDWNKFVERGRGHDRRRH